MRHLGQERLLFDSSDEPQEIGAAVFSPDWRRVAVPGRTKAGEGVWILNLDGDGKRLLTSDRFNPLAWVGDSLFYRTDESIRAMSVTTGMSRLRNRRPADCNDVAFAPSRDWILCTRTQNFQDVWLIEGFDRP